jgi:PRTRC genetic system protein B
MNTPTIDITNEFAQVYFPDGALVFYRHALEKEKIYIEKFDCSSSGHLINAHPLSAKEIDALAELMQNTKVKNNLFDCEDLLPETVLYVNAAKKSIIWYTPPRVSPLYFASSLELNDGQMPIPALIWKATDNELYLFATTETKKPVASTKLFHAPFFNIHDNANVCMGTVDVNMKNISGISEFIRTWQSYFFHSKFSHTLGSQRRTRTEMITIYKSLINQQNGFPQKELISAKKTLQQIIP